MDFTKFAGLFLVILNFGIVAGCGGGGSGGMTDSDVRKVDDGLITHLAVTDNVESQTVSLSGAAVKGPLAFARIKLYELDTSEALFYDSTLPIATSETNEAGAIKEFHVPRSARPPYVLVVEGEDSIDLNSGETPVITRMANVVTAEMLSSQAAVYVTPLTTMAFQMAVHGTHPDSSDTTFEHTINNAAKRLTSTLGFGLSSDVDILRDPPLLTEATDTAEEQQDVVQLRAASEAVSGLVYEMANADELSADQMLNRLALDLQSDGTIDNAANGEPIGGIDLTLISSDPAEIYVPNTSVKIKNLTDLLNRERVVINPRLRPLSDDVTLNLRAASLNVDEDNDGILNINEQPVVNQSSNESADSIGEVATNDMGIGAEVTLDSVSQEMPASTSGWDVREEAAANAASMAVDSASSKKMLIPKDNWTLLYVDSEELVGAYRPAINAFDGDPSTFWITEWSDQQTPYPHELQIDLGQAYELHGLRYLYRRWR